jgi:alanine racemase
VSVSEKITAKLKIAFEPLELELIDDSANLDLVGIYTHFAESHKPEGFTVRQRERFLDVTTEYEQRTGKTVTKHAANSGAIVSMPDSHFDMARPGILLYGMSPDGSLKAPDGFKPVMRLAASIANIKIIEAGESVSYGRIFTASRRTRVGLLPIGYADGYARSLSNKAMVVIRGKRIPLIGRVCMDQFMVDLTDAPEVAVGDEATLFGTEDLPAGFLTRLMGTLDYELTCGISKRVPRVVCRGGECQ